MARRAGFLFRRAEYYRMDTNNNNFTRQNDFISSLILRASELAYVEGAQGASHLLACLHGFIRYMRQDAK